MRGKWAAGIEPRNFTWVFRGALAVSERPGGSTLVHRRVRRDEELIWLKAQGVTRMISILPDVQSGVAHDDHGITAINYPLTDLDEVATLMTAIFTDVKTATAKGDVVLLHGDDVSDRLLGLIAAYIAWDGRVATDTIAITAVERLFKRSIGPEGREMVRLVPEA